MSWSADQKFVGIFDRNPAQGIELGDRVAFDPSTGGRMDTTQIAATAIYAPLTRLAVGAYFPFLQLVQFEDSTFVSTTRGPGDLRSWLGWQVTPDRIDVGTTLRLRAKFPMSTLPVEFETIPLSEGQLDVTAEQETTWAPLPRLHFGLRTSVTSRRPFRDADRVIKPGDEAEAALSVGGAPVAPIWLSAELTSLWSTGSEDRSGPGAVTLRDRRQFQDARVSMYVKFGQWIAPALSGLAIDASVVVPLAGQDYPAGWSWSAGVAWELLLHD